MNTQHCHMCNRYLSLQQPCGYSDNLLLDGSGSKSSSCNVLYPEFLGYLGMWCTLLVRFSNTIYGARHAEPAGISSSSRHSVQQPGLLSLMLHQTFVCSYFAARLLLMTDDGRALYAPRPAHGPCAAVGIVHVISSWPRSFVFGVISVQALKHVLKLELAVEEQHLGTISYCVKNKISTIVF